MAIRASLCLIFATFCLFLSSLSQGYKFYVGGRDGWVLKPSEGYNHWAERNRFQVNDTLLFELKTGDDSVLQVTKENYEQCSIQNPIKSLPESESKSEYKFERSGPHYLISGNTDHCNKGQKIIIVVLAIRPKVTPASPTPVVSPPLPPTPTTDISSLSPSPGDIDGGGHSPSEKKNSGAGYGSPLVGVVLCVVLGISVFLGGLV